ncbi:hypothetical protein [Thiothrix caldifontis]|nr:hypothetical protein [Thiothrix caldifontis]
MAWIKTYVSINSGVARFPFPNQLFREFYIMKIKSQVAIAGLLFAGLLTTGCQQMGQQTSQQAAPEAPAVVAPAAPVAPVRQAPAPVVPKVKAKGNYKGPVVMDPASQGAMQQYQK